MRSPGTKAFTPTLAFLAVDAAVEVIARSHLAFQIVHSQIRRIGVRRFPYGLFFKVESNRIVVIACMHGKRHPKRWNLRRGES